MNNNKLDIVNLVKSQSYLTSLALSDNRNKNQIKLNCQNRNTYIEEIYAIVVTKSTPEKIYRKKFIIFNYIFK